MVFGSTGVAFCFRRLAFICFTSSALRPAAHPCGSVPETRLPEKVASRRKKSRMRSRLKPVTGGRSNKSFLTISADGLTDNKLFGVPIRVNTKIDGRPAFDPQPTGLQSDEKQHVESPPGVGTIPMCELVFAFKEGELSSPE